MSRQISFRFPGSNERKGSPILRFLILLSCALAFTLSVAAADSGGSLRQRISINEDWRFMKYDTPQEADDLIYDVRPELKDTRDDRAADAQPTEAVDVEAKQMVLKPWILPTGNDFLKDPAQRHIRPQESPAAIFPLYRATSMTNRGNA